MVKVSVIVPTYNREKYLSAAIDNLKNQTLQDIEFIVIDDGSEDNTASVLKTLVGKDKRFQIIHYKDNQGPSYARNRGLDVAKGDYIGFFDIDDSIPNDYYEVLYDIAVKTKSDIAFAAVGQNPNNLKEKLDLLRKGCIWDKLYKKERIDAFNIRFEEGLYTADTLFTLQAVYYSKKMTLTDQTQYNYALKKDSIGYRKETSAKRKDDIFVVIGKIKDFAQKKSIDKAEEESLCAFLNRCYAAYPNDKNFQKKLSYVLGVKEKTTPQKDLFWLKINKTLHLINTPTYKERRAIIFFKNSSLFDKEWYLIQYPEARTSTLEPEQHYYRKGWKLGFNPSAAFDGNAYLAEHGDVKASGINPLEHYILSGQFEGRYYVAVNGKANTAPVENLQFIPKPPKAKVQDRMRHIWEYPVRVQEECKRLQAEIRELEQMNK